MEAKKRRMVLTPVASVRPSSVASKPSVSLSANVTHGLANVRHATQETVNSAQQLGALLRAQADEALRTHDRWVRSPRASWIRMLLAELDSDARAALLAKQRRMRTLVADDFGSRWEIAAGFGSSVVELWFALPGRTLDDVLAKSTAFGQDQLRSGVVLSGAYVRELAVGQTVTTEELLPWVRSLATPAAKRPAGEASGEAVDKVSLYRVRADNHFHTEPSTVARIDALEEELRERLSSGRGGCGSLNTTFEYGGSHGDDDGASGVPLLDSYWGVLDELSYTLDDKAARCNERLYLIWKQQGYCTPYHQDVHVPPHFTLYNQVSGYSTFHFLPVLVGLYATYVGREHGAAALSQLLDALAARGIGELATLGPKQMLLILPAGAHGVYVPRVPNAVHSPELHPFEWSVIRAAELYVWPVHQILEAELMRGDGGGGEWCEFIEPSAEESERDERLLDRFGACQEKVCAELGLSREDWLYVATRLQQRWDTEQQQRPHGAEPEGAHGIIASDGVVGRLDDAGAGL